MTDLQIDGKPVTVDGRGQFHVVENGQDVVAGSLAALKAKLKKIAVSDTQFPFEGFQVEAGYRSGVYPPEAVTAVGIEKSRRRSWNDHKFQVKASGDTRIREAKVVYEFTPEQVAEITAMAQEIENADRALSNLKQARVKRRDEITEATPRYSLDEHANIVKVVPE